ncbi:flagellar protein FlhE [Polymorphospora rubra]|uniref:Secreted protein n=1 Tax=Polymorphospora rubra TaxID=338584 RepID=A0A810N5F6_9ACTN|nr:flagellar protein FlhE [Polymorphospora rubra]BCJ67419.1 hypothetical protein Prubr_44400 [Polymorphospora rubra]
MLQTSIPRARTTVTGRVRHRALTLIAALLAGIVATVSLTTPAHAATSSWSHTQGTADPTIYQTNLWYYGTPFVPPATTPATGVITTVDYEWAIWDAPPPSLVYTVYLCAGSYGCLLVSPTAWAATSSSGSTSAFAGIPANTTFRYQVGLGAPTTYVLFPQRNSRMYRLTVTYNY